MSRPPMPRYTKQPDKQAFYIQKAMEIKGENPSMSLGDVFDRAYDFTEKNYVPRWQREKLQQEERELKNKERRLAVVQQKKNKNRNYTFINRMMGLCVICGSTTNDCICEE